MAASAESEQAAALAILAHCWQLYLPSEPAQAARTSRSRSSTQNKTPADEHAQQQDKCNLHDIGGLSSDLSSSGSLNGQQSAGTWKQQSAPAQHGRDGVRGERPGNAHESESQNGGPVLDVRAAGEFWGLLRACLVSCNSHVSDAAHMRAHIPLSFLGLTCASNKLCRHHGMIRPPDKHITKGGQHLLARAWPGPCMHCDCIKVSCMHLISWHLLAGITAVARADASADVSPPAMLHKQNSDPLCVLDLCA